MDWILISTVRLSFGIVLKETAVTKRKLETMDLSVGEL